MDNQIEYNYEASGFNKFLRRPIGNVRRVPSLPSRQLNFDQQQVTGFLGDTLQVGHISINNTNIVVDDGNNQRVLIGDDQDGF